MDRQIPWSHPVSDEVRKRILNELASIEQAHDVRVLFACESGSRGWGFASPDSDYDVRFIYVHRPEWYLRIEPQRDVIEKPISDELDVGGWELRKALQLMRRSNPTLFEWLDSPVIYRENDSVTQRMRALAPPFFSDVKGRWHYLSMANKTWRTHFTADTVKLKKYLYVLRPLLAARWIDAGKGMPPMRFARLAEALVQDPNVRDEINALLRLKMSSVEHRHASRFARIDAYIEAELVAMETQPDYKKPSGDERMLDRLFRDVVMG